jgi:transposase-like protein
MISEVSKRWIAAAGVLSQDVSAIVPCPACAADHLRVQEIALSSDRWELRLHCPACGEQNYVLLAPGAKPKR